MSGSDSGCCSRSGSLRGGESGIRGRRVGGGVSCG